MSKDSSSSIGDIILGIVIVVGIVCVFGLAIWYNATHPRPPPGPPPPMFPGGPGFHLSF